MDPLTALRSFVTSGGDLDTVVVTDESITIDDHVFPRKAETPWRAKNKKLLTVEAVWFALKYEEMNLGKYVQTCLREHVDRPEHGEKRQLLSYLKGEIFTAIQIDDSIIAKYNNLEEEPEARPTKRLKTDSTDPDQSDNINQKEHGELSERPTIKEYLLETRESCLLAPPTHKGFPEVIGLYEKRMKSRRSQHIQQTAGFMMPGKSLAHTRTEIPIVVVPSALSSLVNMNNVQELLEFSKYVAGDKKKKTTDDSSGRKSIELQIFSEKLNKKIPVQVTDSPEPGDWKRVVAVFVHGPNWQFKPYKYKPPMLFQKTIGFHLHWDNEKPHPNILKWRVQTIPISRNNRHHDSKTVYELWRKFRTFVEKHDNKNLRM
eukprot:826711_1